MLPARGSDRNGAAWTLLRFVDRDMAAPETDGWIIEFDEGAHLDYHDVDRILFDVGIEVDMEGSRIDLVPLLAALMGEIDGPDDRDDDRPVLFEIAPGKWLKLPASPGDRADEPDE